MNGSIAIAILTQHQTVQDSELKVMVPATSANLGPGFDSLGIALDLWNTVEASISTTPKINISGEGSDYLSRFEDNLVYKSAQMAFREAGENPPTLSLICKNRIQRFQNRFSSMG